MTMMTLSAFPVPHFRRPPSPNKPPSVSELALGLMVLGISQYRHEYRPRQSRSVVTETLGESEKN
jgi:hypothetical protein